MLKSNLSLKRLFSASHKILSNYDKTNKFSHFPYYSFSVRDEKFWEEYSQRKAQGGKYPALESQEIIYNKVVHSWKYSDKHSLTSEEFLNSLRDLKLEPVCPFVILDVREESEYDLYKLPLRNKGGILIPIIYRPMDEINYGNYGDIPLDKYIICIDSLGLRGRMAARILNGEGHLTLYVEGGYDMFVELIKSKEF